MKVITKIGGGGISDVYLVTDDKEKYAFKTLNHFKSSDKVAQAYLKNEYDILLRIHHENIIKCIDWIMINGREGILMEFFEGVKLSGLSKSKLTDSLFIEIEQTIIYINEMLPPIFHNDITEKNILIGFNEEIRIIDFSMSYSESLDSQFLNQRNDLTTDIKQFKILKTKYLKT